MEVTFTLSTLISPNLPFTAYRSRPETELVTSLSRQRLGWSIAGKWTGLAEDDSPLVLRDTGSEEIYALDWEAP